MQTFTFLLGKTTTIFLHIYPIKCDVKLKQYSWQTHTKPNFKTIFFSLFFMQPFQTQKDWRLYDGQHTSNAENATKTTNTANATKTTNTANAISPFSEFEILCRMRPPQPVK